MSRERSTLAIIAAMLAALPALAQDVGSGARIYQDYKCYSCHGYNGTNLTVPLANDLSGIMVNEDVFIAFLRQRAELNPATASRAMPNYAESVLSDAQAKDLYAFIKTLEDDPPEVDADPLMQQILNAAKAQDPSGE
jgi:mono/diheme cytochrome c family protein